MPTTTDPNRPKNLTLHWRRAAAALVLLAACSRDGGRGFFGRGGSGDEWDAGSYATVSNGEIDTSFLRSGRYHGPPITSPPTAAPMVAEPGTDPSANGALLDSLRAAAEAERLQREAESAAARAQDSNVVDSAPPSDPLPPPRRRVPAPAPPAEPRPDSARPQPAPKPSEPRPDTGSGQPSAPKPTSPPQPTQPSSSTEPL